MPSVWDIHKEPSVWDLEKLDRAWDELHNGTGKEEIPVGELAQLEKLEGLRLNPPCPKCGDTFHKVRYIHAFDALLWTCKRCGWDWTTAPLDRTDSGEA